MSSITAPMVRVRIAHAHTMKEGWRLSETTVEALRKVAR